MCNFHWQISVFLFFFFLQILSIDWSSGIENLKCIGRIDLTLNGSFADLALLQNDGISKTRGAFILTNPGQLHFYDDACFASLMSQQQKQNSVSSLEYPAVIPVLEPCMTVGKLGFICRDEKFSKAFSKVCLLWKKCFNRCCIFWWVDHHFTTQVSQVQTLVKLAYL